MNKLTCEMCGSNDLIKQDGVFVCQNCGCKYSMEDAKKMMVEGTVDITGSSVKIDTSEELNNLYELARRSKKDDNTKNALKYYEQIIVKNPSSWEANFYCIYYQIYNCDKNKLLHELQNMLKAENTILKLIKDNIFEPDECKNAIIEVKNKLITLSDVMFKNTKVEYFSHSVDKRENFSQITFDKCMTISKILYQYGDNVINIFGEDYAKEISIVCWKSAISSNKRFLKTFAYNINSVEALIKKYEEKIKYYDNTYQSVLSSKQQYTKRDKVINQQQEAEGCGCSGCLNIIVFLVVFIIALIILGVI